MAIINKLELAILVYDDDKECGAAVLELHVDSAIYRWEQGQGQDWEDPSVKRFSYPALAIDITGKELVCYGKLEERQYEVNIDAGLEWDAVFHLDDGSTKKFGGRHYYYTGKGITSFKLDERA